MSKAKDINPVEVEKLASLGCKTTEIAAFFDCSRDTIERHFAANLTKGRETLKISLRRWQIEAAKKGNVTMLIWLGKQLLDQSDKVVRIDDEESTKQVPLSPEALVEIIKASRKKSTGESA